MLYDLVRFDHNPAFIIYKTYLEGKLKVNKVNVSYIANFFV